MSESDARTLQPPSALLMGPPGSGKTSSLVTFPQAGVELFVLTTEPGGAESLLDAAARMKVPVDLIHWKSIAPAAPGWGALNAMAKTVKAMSYEDIAKIKQGVGKGEMQALHTILETLQDFKDDRTGKTFGDVTEWTNNRAFVIDSLSGLNLIVMAHTIGYKPSAHQGEWGIAMNIEEQLMLKLTSDCKCYFVLTAHIDREVDEITGAQRIMAGALGRKLAPKIPRFFSEVILSTRQAQAPNFTWSTLDNSADLKNRALPVKQGQEPSFAPIVAAYKRRLSAMAGPAAPALAAPSKSA